jgi:pyrroline-5-carboxylate reductase
MKKIAIIGLGKWGRILLKEFYKKTNISICVSKGNKKIFLGFINIILT